jgi:4-alpha-glucanotransferase
MSINLGIYTLVSALAVGGAVAQHQYAQPAGPSEPMEPEASTPISDSSTTGTATGVLDCKTLMTHHQQMNQELDQLDAQAATLLSQMKDAQADRAKLDATMGVVEALVNQRKQMRDRMGTMEHETLQFVMSNRTADWSACSSAMTEMNDSASQDTTEQGGPNDMELGNDR